MMNLKIIIQKLHKFYSVIWDNIEKVKSVLLVMLIGLSILLTWNLWTYTPHINVLEDDEPINTAIEGGQKKNLTNIIKPKQVIIHQNGKHLWSYGAGQVELYNELQSDLLLDGNKVSFEKDVTSNEWVEIIFPTPIPMDVLRETFNYGTNRDKAMYLNGQQAVEKLRVLLKDGKWKVQFIVVRQSDTQIEDVKVPEFQLSNKPNFSKKLREALESNAEDDKYQYVETEPYKMDNGKTYYLPLNDMSIKTYKVITDTMKMDAFVNALLPGNYVKKPSNETNTIFYLKQRSQIKYFDEGIASFTYINNQYKQETAIRQSSIIQSLDFINLHAGWTYDYNLNHFYGAENQEVNASQKELHFRMMKDGFPVIDDTVGSKTITTIEVESTNNQISRYNRSLIDPERAVVAPAAMVQNAKKVKATLEELKTNYENLEIKDLTLGYKPIYNSTHLDLVPTWYYKGLTSSWIELNFNMKETPANKGG
jgi:regulatory protein YycH of two-component signal transduction system YycFG